MKIFETLPDETLAKAYDKLKFPSTLRIDVKVKSRMMRAVINGALTDAPFKNWLDCITFLKNSLFE